MGEKLKTDFIYAGSRTNALHHLLRFSSAGNIQSNNKAFPHLRG